MRVRGRRVSLTRPALVLLAALAFGVGAAIFGIAGLDRLAPFAGDDPDAESAIAERAIAAGTGADPGPPLRALVSPAARADAVSGRAAVQAVASAAFDDPDVAVVETPFDPGAERADLLSGDGRSAIVEIRLRDVVADSRSAAVERLRGALAPLDGYAGLTGPAAFAADVQGTASADLARAELIVLPLLVLLLVSFFRGLVAAALTLSLGALAIALTLAALRLLAGLTDVTVFAVDAVLGLGLALAVDYGLLLGARYRGEAARRGFGAEAIAATLRSAGRTVGFSATAVALAMAVMVVFPQPILRSIGIGGLVVAALTAACALVVLPAALAVLGPRIDALSPPWLRRRAAGVGGSRWRGLAAAVMRRPVLTAASCALALLALASPLLGTRLVSEKVVGAELLPAEAESALVAERIRSGFPAEPPTSLALVAAVPPRESASLARELGGLDGVDGVADPIAVGERGSLIAIDAVAQPDSSRALDLVAEIRGLDAPFETALGGAAASFDDQRESLLAHLPLIAGLVLAGMLAIVVALTGSVVLAVKTALMHALSIAAALGLVVAIFQDGALAFIGIDPRAPIELTTPIVIAIFGFALSTDYGLFLLARIREARLAGAPDAEAIASGVERTGRLISAAALIVAVSFGAFVSSDFVFVQALGAGLALTVLIDAFLVRALLVPALMAILGRWNWWSPGWVERFASRRRSRPRTEA